MVEFKIPSVPAMPHDAVARLEQGLRSSRSYLEYGSGGSTALALRSGIQALICVESDQAWLAQLKASLPPADQVQCHFIHADIGPTKEWGHPVDHSRWPQFHTYPLAGWLTAKAEGLEPDLVLIDGRFRRACFYSALIFAAPGTVVLFDDYSDRRFYHSVERLCRPVAMHDRMAEFIIPADVDKTSAWLAFTQAVTELH